MEHSSLLLNSVWVIKFGALGDGGERERGGETNKLNMDHIPAVPIYILF